jgi:transcriptional regulator with AAA-type ATPase domain
VISTIRRYDIERLARAVVALEHAKLEHKELLLELDRHGASYSDLARVCGTTRQGMREQLRRWKGEA